MRLQPQIGYLACCSVAFWVCCSVLHCIAFCCIVLHCVRVRCSVWQCVAAQHFECVSECCSLLQRVALRIAAFWVCCRVLQCIALCCIVLECVAVCVSALQHGISSVFQSVAVRCSVLQPRIPKGLTNSKKINAMTHSRAGYETLRYFFYS